MKFHVHTIGFAAVSLFIAAIRGEGAQPPSPPIAGPISFIGSGVSITPGSGWYRYDLPAGAGVFVPDGTLCGPIIVSDSGMLSVSVRDKLHSTLDLMAATLRAECQRLASADKQSFRREPFVTESGLRGFHVSYVQRNLRDGRATATRCHHYLVTNRDGQGVDIAYLADAERDSNVAHQMVRQSLTLQ